MAREGFPTNNEKLLMPCPAESAWIDLAAGASTGEYAESLLAHAANCGNCADKLKVAVSVFDDEQRVPAEFSLEFRVNSAGGRRVIASRMAAKGSESTPARGRFEKDRWAKWMVAAAAVGIILLGGLWMRRKQNEPPLDLLARSYGMQRPFELRVEGGAYGPVRMQRGGGGVGISAELLEARASISHHLDQNAKDARFLHAKGRADLLSWRFNDAIQSFQAAESLGLDDASFWVDFGTAYFERAEANQEAINYSKAVEFLSTALQKRPAYAVALFNRGIVYSKLRQFDLANADFEEFLKVEKDSGWRKEAAERLAEIRRLRTSLPVHTREETNAEFSFDRPRGHSHRSAPSS